jgi:hypothetical protein
MKIDLKYCLDVRDLDLENLRKCSIFAFDMCDPSHTTLMLACRDMNKKETPGPMQEHFPEQMSPKYVLDTLSTPRPFLGG